MNTRTFRALVMALLTTSVTTQVQADDPAAVFMTADVWPWGYLDEERRPAGLIAELAEELGRVAGMPVENRIVPHPRLIRELRQGNVTFAVLFDNPLLDDFTVNLGPVLNTHLMFLSLERNQLDLSLKGLGGKRVGYIRGTYYGQAFDEDGGMIKVAISDLTQGLNMLTMDRLDAIMISEIVLHHTLRQLSLDINDFVYAVHTHSHPGNLYMFHQPSHPEQGERMRAALDALRQSGELDRLFSLGLPNAPN